MMGVIGVDASRAVASRRTGTENYSRHLIRALSKLEHDSSIRLYFPDGSSTEALPEQAPGIEHRPVVGSRLWTHLHLSREMRRDPVDLLFVPAHVIPLVHPASVVTVHDVGYLHHPQDHPTRQRWMLDITTRWSLRVARRVIVPSRFTADDLVTRVPGSESKIDVVPHGVAPSFAPVPEVSVQELLHRRGVERPYVLSVGTIQPRKNYPTLAEAVAIHNRANPVHQLRTVIAGYPGWLVDRVLRELEPFRADARLTILPDVSDDDLPALYSGATGYVQPSRFEGFGMPLLEAMACGAPIIYANTSSLPEVAGDAGLPFAVENAAELAERIHALRVEPELRRMLTHRGIQRARTFTWQRAASSTMAVLERAMHHI